MKTVFVTLHGALSESGSNCARLHHGAIAGLRLLAELDYRVIVIDNTSAASALDAPGSPPRPYKGEAPWAADPHPAQAAKRPAAPPGSPQRRRTDRARAAADATGATGATGAALHRRARIKALLGEARLPLLDLCHCLHQQADGHAELRPCAVDGSPPAAPERAEHACAAIGASGGTPFSIRGRGMGTAPDGQRGGKGGKDGGKDGPDGRKERGQQGAVQQHGGGIGPVQQHGGVTGPVQTCGGVTGAVQTRGGITGAVAGATGSVCCLRCTCLPPQPLLLLRAAARHGIDLPASWLLGAELDAVEAGNRAGCRTVLIDNGTERAWRLGRGRIPTRIAPDLHAAALRIIEEGQRLRRC